MNHQENRVAVIGIHGVADQQPSQTAQRISDLLLRLERDNVAYQAFNRTDLRVPVRRVAFEPVPSPQRKTLADAFRVDPRAECIKQAHRRPRGQSISAALADLWQADESGQARPGPARESGEWLDYAYMREQLSEYEPGDKDGFYESVRLTGSRISRGEHRCEVHIY